MVTSPGWTVTPYAGTSTGPVTSSRRSSAYVVMAMTPSMSSWPVSMP